MRIEIIVSPQGDSQVHTTGFSGSECRQASQPFEQALGLKAAEQLTAEFYQHGETSETNHERA